MNRLLAFGEPRLVARGGAASDEIARKYKRFALLIYLTCDSLDELHRRDEIIAMFWPEGDVDHGRNALRQALFVLRDELGGDAIITNGPQEVRVNAASITSDVLDFETALHQGRPEEALALYKAEFLGAFGVPDTPAFEAWVEDRRFELARLAGAAARDLAHTAEGERDLHTALHWWRRVLGAEPYDEAALCRIMALCAAAGNRGEAMAAYDRFRKRLLADLELEPSPTTQEIARAVSVTHPEGISPWVGDRRNAPPGLRSRGSGPERHWRRTSDRADR